MKKNVYVIDEFMYTDDHHYFPEVSSVEAICATANLAYAKAAELLLERLYECHDAKLDKLMKTLNFDSLFTKPKQFYEECYELAKKRHGGDRGLWRGEMQQAFGTYYTVTKKQIEYI
jgi:hypothetical protein